MARKRRELWVLDAETDPFQGEMVDFGAFIWGLFNGDDYYEFADSREMIEFILTLGDVVIYAHNGGKFDYFLGVFFEYLEPFDEITIINGRVAKFKIQNAEFRDSFNILPIPLRAWQKDSFDYEKMRRDVRAKHMKEIREYLRSDCINQYDMVSAFISEYGFNLTLAGSALKQWEKISGLEAPKTSESFYDMLAPYYYGGRVEARQKGIITRPFSVVDINSAYPDAMKKKHAWGDDYIIKDGELPTRNIERSFIQFYGVSRGALPFREADGSLSFPNDQMPRVYSVTGWEYVAGLRTGTIDVFDVFKSISFLDSMSFNNYVDHFYKMKTGAKKSGDKSAYTFSKLFLNSLYGKFGANPNNYGRYTALEPSQVWASMELEGTRPAGQLGHMQIVEGDLLEHEKRFYNAATAASITGCVRAKLFEAIHHCGPENVIYCDTDSLATYNIGSLDISDKLGEWDIEAGNCPSGAIAGKKLYAFEYREPVTDTDGTIIATHKIASKGAKLTAKEVYAVARGKQIVYHPMAPTISMTRGIVWTDRTIRMT